MTEREVPEQPVQEPEPRPYRIRLPGLVGDEEIGLGDAIKGALQALHLARATPCYRCGKRAAALNRWIVFTR
jgi:hypothetical protein